MINCKMTLLRVPDEYHSLGSKAALTEDVHRIWDTVWDEVIDNGLQIQSEVMVYEFDSISDWSQNSLQWNGNVLNLLAMKHKKLSL